MSSDNRRDKKDDSRSSKLNVVKGVLNMASNSRSKVTRDKFDLPWYAQEYIENNPSSKLGNAYGYQASHPLSKDDEYSELNSSLEEGDNTGSTVLPRSGRRESRQEEHDAYLRALLAAKGPQAHQSDESALDHHVKTEQYEPHDTDNHEFIKEEASMRAQIAEKRWKKLAVAAHVVGNSALKSARERETQARIEAAAKKKAIKASSMAKIRTSNRDDDSTSSRVETGRPKEGRKASLEGEAAAHEAAAASASPHGQDKVAAPFAGAATDQRDMMIMELQMQMKQLLAQQQMQMHVQMQQMQQPQMQQMQQPQMQQKQAQMYEQMPPQLHQNFTSRTPSVPGTARSSASRGTQKFSRRIHSSHANSEKEAKYLLDHIDEPDDTSTIITSASLHDSEVDHADNELAGSGNGMVSSEQQQFELPSVEKVNHHRSLPTLDLLDESLSAAKERYHLSEEDRTKALDNAVGTGLNKSAFVKPPEGRQARVLGGAGGGIPVSEEDKDAAAKGHYSQPQLLTGNEALDNRELQRYQAVLEKPITFLTQSSIYGDPSMKNMFTLARVMQKKMIPLLQEKVSSEGSKPMHLLDGLDRQMQNFLSEVSAIKIQSFVRSSVAKLKVMALKRRKGVKERMLPLLCYRLLEDALTSMSVVVATDAYNALTRKEAREESQTYEISHVVKQIVEETLVHNAGAVITMGNQKVGAAMQDLASVGYIRQIVEETIHIEVREYMMKRQRETSNPFVKVINEIIDEAISDDLEQAHANVGMPIALNGQSTVERRSRTVGMTRLVAREAITEAVQEYLLDAHAEYVYDCVVEEIMREGAVPHIPYFHNQRLAQQALITNTDFLRESGSVVSMDATDMTVTSIQSSPTVGDADTTQNNDEKVDKNAQGLTATDGVDKLERDSDAVSTVGGSTESFELLQTQETYVHEDFACDICQVNPIVGLRYESKSKEDYDVCSSCYAKATEEDKKDLVPQYAHFDIGCDECMMFPIVGIRYHCLARADYDLCAKCEGNKTEDEKLKFPSLAMAIPAEYDEDFKVTNYDHPLLVGSDSKASLAATNRSARLSKVNSGTNEPDMQGKAQALLNQSSSNFSESQKTLLKTAKSPTGMCILDPVEEWQSDPEHKFYNLQIATIIDESLMDLVVSGIYYAYEAEVTRKYSEEITEGIIDEMESELRAVKDQADIEAIRRISEVVICREFMVGHLLLQVGDNMNNILIEHYMRGLMRRIIAQRVVDMLDTVEVHEARIADVDHSAPLRAILSDSISDPIVESIVVMFREDNLRAVDEIDIFEGYYCENDGEQASIPIQPDEIVGDVSDRWYEDTSEYTWSAFDKNPHQRDEDDELGMGRNMSHASIHSKHTTDGEALSPGRPSGDYVPGSNLQENLAKLRAATNIVGKIAAEMDVRANSEAAELAMSRAAIVNQGKIDAENEFISPKQARDLADKIALESERKAELDAAESKKLAEAGVSRSSSVSSLGQKSVTGS